VVWVPLVVHEGLQGGMWICIFLFFFTKKYIHSYHFSNVVLLITSKFLCISLIAYKISQTCCSCCICANSGFLNFDLSTLCSEDWVFLEKAVCGDSMVPTKCYVIERSLRTTTIMAANTYFGSWSFLKPVALIVRWSTTAK